MKRFIVLFLLLIGVLAVPALAAISDPVSSVVSANNILYVPNQTSNQVLVWDTSVSPSVLKNTINLPGTPRGLALSPNGSTLYISTAVNPDVRAYDVTNPALPSFSGSFTGIALQAPRQIAVSSDGLRLYVVDSIANKVLVYNAQTRTFITSINVGVSNLYGIAVSSDNSMVAVTQRNNVGSVYIYNINRDSNNNIVNYTQKLAKTDAFFMYPSYLVFSADSSRLFVRVNQNYGSYADVVVLSGNNFANALATITLVAADEHDTLNPNGEAMSMSSNGQYLYLTHYRATKDSASDADSTLSKVHAYRISTMQFNDNSNVWEARSNWTLDYSQHSFTDVNGTPFVTTYDGIMQNNVPPSIDGATAVSDGSRVWFSDSESGYKAFSKWTGITDATGNLTNPLPGAPTIVHPAIGDDLVNYTGGINWSGNSGYFYEVNYRATGETTWHNILPYSANTSTALPAQIVTGKSYLISARMYSGANWGPYAYSPQFKKANPTITSIKKDTTVVSNGYIYDGLRIIGSGFGVRDVASQAVDGSDYNISFSSKVIPYQEGTQTRISSWTDTEIDVVIPRKFKDASNMIIGPVNIVVTAFNIASNSQSFTVSPVITSMNPKFGPVGATVDLYGVGFGAVQGTSNVYFNGNVPAAIVSWASEANSDHIVCTVPQGLAASFVPVKVTVNNMDTWSKYQATGNADVTFEVKAVVSQNPVISRFKVDQNPDANITTWGPETTEAVVYDHILIMGSNFGNDPGDGNRATALNNVTIGGHMIRNDAGGAGLQVYSWKDTEIELGIPRKVRIQDGYAFIDSGTNPVVVTANNLISDPMALTIKPTIYSVSPSSGQTGTKVSVSGTALEKVAGVRRVFFDATDAGEGSSSRADGTNPDGTDGTDTVTIEVPASLTPSDTPYLVSINVNNSDSNNNKTFKVLPPPPAGSPVVLTIIPNAAPNTGSIEVKINGSNFQSNVTVSLAKAGEANIDGNITNKSLTQLTVSLPISGKTPGKWDVVVTNPGNPATTKSKAFTILDGSITGAETLEVLDDFEGVQVAPADYVVFPTGGQLTFSLSAIDKYDGDQSGSASYPLSALGYRGYNAHLATAQDISLFSNIVIMVKGDGTTPGKVKAQITAGGHSYGAPGNEITLTNNSWTKYTIPLSAFVEIDASGAPVSGGGIVLDKTKITDYQLVFTGNDASVGTIYVDQLAAGGYLTPVITPADVAKNLKAAKSGNDVNLSWDAPTNAPSNGYNVYTGTTASNMTTLLAAVPAGTTYLHAGAVADADSHYYVVKSVSGANESAASNMAYVIKTPVTFNTDKGNKKWISVPYTNQYAALADIIQDINGIADITTAPGILAAPTKCDYIARLNPTTQQYEAVWWDGSIWNSATDDAATDKLETPAAGVGDGYEVSLLQSFNLVIAGSYDPNFSFNLSYNSDKGNKHWISIPYNTSYASLASIAASINGVADITTAPGILAAPTKCDYIARLNPTTQQYEAVWWDGSIWNSATDDAATDNLETPAVVVGEGYEISILQGLTFKPSSL